MPSCREKQGEEEGRHRQGHEALFLDRGSSCHERCEGKHPAQRCPAFSREGVIAPAVLRLPAEWANGVPVPDCHAEPASETGCEKGEGRWVSGEFGRDVSQAPAQGCG